MNRFPPTAEQTRLAILARVAAAAAALALPPHSLADSGDASRPNEPIVQNAVEEYESFVWPKVDFPDSEARGRGLRPGERFSYQARWGIFRRAGVLTIETKASASEGRKELIVQSTTRSAGIIGAIYPVAYFGQAVIDANEWRMKTLSVEGEVRSKETKAVMELDYGNGLMRYQDSEKPESNIARSIPYPYAFDYSSAILQMRGWDLTEGKVYPLLIATEGKFYYIKMEVRGIQEVRTDDGREKAFLVEPVSSYPQSSLLEDGGAVSIWISADERRLPLRFDIQTNAGQASMRLQSYQLSADPLLASRHY